MSKKPSDLQKAIDDFGEAYVAMCVEFVKAMKPLLEKMKEVREAGGLDPFKEPEIVIIEQSAIPAGYFMRPDVQAAVLAEIIKDYKATGKVAPGAQLIGQEEESNGETEKISDQENDSVVGDDGSGAEGDSSDNGGQASGGGEDHPGDATQESINDGSSSDSESSPEKPGDE